METTIYIDSLFVLNLIINYLLLLATAKVSGSPINRWRIFAGAAAGAAYAVAVFLPGLKFLQMLPCKGAFALLMVLIAFGVRSWRAFIRSVLLFLAISFVFGGGVMAAWLIFGGSGILAGGVPYLPIDMKTLLLTAGICYVLLAVVFRRLAKRGTAGGGLVEVELSMKDNKVALTALVDTGNTLHDPLTNAPVMVAEFESVRPLLPREVTAFINRETLKDPARALEDIALLGHGRYFRLIPYQAVGVSSGILLAFRPDSAAVNSKRVDGMLIALSPTHLSDSSAYSALVGA